MRAVASNVRGTGAITRGQKSCAITVRTGDTVVALERGDGSGTYSILSADGQVTRYTKLAGGVPEQVTEALRIAPVPTGGTSINFAGQFDKPYLLDESGANVARELGELTNVNVIFEAVRAANKTRASLATALKTRQADLAACQQQITAFADLPAKLAAIEQAETLADQVTGYADRVTRLTYATEQLVLAEQVLARHQVPQVPDLDDLHEMVGRRDLLTRLISMLTNSEQEISQHEQEVDRLTAASTAIDTELADLLHRAGRCPTCGADTA